MPALTSGLGGAATGMIGLGGATTTATGAMVAKTSALRAALPLISRLGVIGAIVGTALLVYANNTFGARDAINALGAALGKIIPAFKAIGEGLVAVAGYLGLTGESAEKVTTHFDNARKGFADMAKGWDTTGNQIRSFFGKLAKDIVKALKLDEISNAFQEAFADVVSQAGQLGADIAAALDNSPIVQWAKATGTAIYNAMKAGVAPISQYLSTLSPQKNVNPTTGIASTNNQMSKKALDTIATVYKQGK